MLGDEICDQVPSENDGDVLFNPIQPCCSGQRTKTQSPTGDSITLLPQRLIASFTMYGSSSPQAQGSSEESVGIMYNTNQSVPCIPCSCPYVLEFLMSWTRAQFFTPNVAFGFEWRLVPNQFIMQVRTSTISPLRTLMSSNFWLGYSQHSLQCLVRLEMLLPRWLSRTFQGSNDTVTE